MSTFGRKTCRSGRRCEIRSLAEAVDCVAHHSDLSLRQLAERVGKSEAYLRAACSQYDDGHRFQAELIVPLTLAARNYAVLDYLEAAVGRVAIQVPDAVGRGDVFERTAMLVHELGEAVNTIRLVMTDGVVSELEAQRVRQQIHQLQTAAASLEACVVSQVRQTADRRPA